MCNKRWYKYIFLFALLGIISGSYWLITYRHVESTISGPIYSFNEQRDTQDILDLFMRDWYWLVTSQDYSPSYMLKYRAPNRNPMYSGKLHIKVLREQRQFIGFVAYYMKKATEGFILFIAVQPQLRGKGYGLQLLNYALTDLKRLGARKVRLLTRTSNVRAQSLYKQANFIESYRENGFVYYEKDV